MPDIDRSRADWDDIKAFVAAAQTGSFGAAARRLRTTQPTITRRIDELEVRLGVRLFDRGIRGVSLTQVGEKVYDQALTMHRASAEIERLAQVADQGDEGEVRISAPEGLAGYVLGLELAGFMRENPMVRLSLDCADEVLSGGEADADLSVQVVEAASPDILSTRIATLHYALFASRDYLNTYGAPTRLEAAAGHRFVYHAAQIRDRWGAKTAAFLELAAPALTLNSSTAMLHAIQRGAGIGAIPTAIVSLAPDLVMLDIPPLASAPLWLCRHRDSLKSPRVSRVADWLTGIFDSRDRPWFRQDFVHPSEFPGWSWPAVTARG